MANAKKAKKGAIWLIIGCILVVALTVWVFFSGITGVSKIISNADLAKSLADTFGTTVRSVDAQEMSQVRYIEIFSDAQNGVYSVAYGLDDLMAELESEAEDADPSKYYHTLSVKADYDFSDLKYFTGLKDAVIYMTNDFDLDVFENAASSLENLTFYYGTPSDISKISKFTALKEVYFTGAAIEDVTPFTTLPNLEKLYLDGNSITDIAPLASLTKLTELSVSSNQVSDISSLSALTELTTLNIGYNQVSDISSLSALTKLESLYAPSCQISDASVITGLTELKNIAFDNNQIADTTAFEALDVEKIDLVSLSGNPLTDTSALDYLGEKLSFTVSEQTTETTEQTDVATEGVEVGEDGSITLTGDALQQFIDEQGMEGVTAAQPDAE